MRARASLRTAAIATTAASIVGFGVWIVVPASAASRGDAPYDYTKHCTILGTSGDDVLVGTADRDVICGRGGNDTIYGRGGNDRLIGEAGNDRLVGGSGKDDLWGLAGEDKLEGGAGNDYLNGGGEEGDSSAGGGGDDVSGDNGVGDWYNVSISADYKDIPTGTKVSWHFTGAGACMTPITTDHEYVVTNDPHYIASDHFRLFHVPSTISLLEACSWKSSSGYWQVNLTPPPGKGAERSGQFFVHTGVPNFVQREGYAECRYWNIPCQGGSSAAGTLDGHLGVSPGVVIGPHS